MTRYNDPIDKEIADAKRRKHRIFSIIIAIPVFIFGWMIYAMIAGAPILPGLVSTMGEQQPGFSEYEIIGYSHAQYAWINDTISAPTKICFDSHALFSDKINHDCYAVKKVSGQ